MKNYLLIALAAFTFGCTAQSKTNSLTEQIETDTQLPQIQEMGLKLLSSGFNAGDGYAEVWIRDFNTFVTQSAKVVDHKLIKDNILNFFYIQEDDGNIADGFITIRPGYDSTYYKKSVHKPTLAYHKNTVETDQEASLVQSVYKYIKATGDKSILQEEVVGKKVIHRLEDAMQFLLDERFNETYQLLWGATTADWGDVQPEHDWGVALDENSHLTIDIYDNAMFVIALNNLIEIGGDDINASKWKVVRAGITKNVAKYLWDEERQKYRPHVYITTSPFPSDFNEDEVFYHGGTAIAIEAGFLTKTQIKVQLDKMVQNVKESGAPSIGLTLYPVYPEGTFKNTGMHPYGYQNGGDWTWFGARMITELVKNGYEQEAWEQAQPMFDRVLKNKGFYEWYTRDNKPTGSGMFRGSAGVLLDAIDAFESLTVNN
ncbi:glucosidase family protein [Flammeovirga kamogawensis]|uniref:Glycosyl hydrolase 36 catalytic domain-containing protein n=1 Tax=Flammeovirga kamogawensis TaxID=373891 RepID=A0ABX8H4X2_9BACT|nr:hypothetical protein [Flammeovirga kamogawensis]MBB6461915.1 hypothetical protein [Flammeovirga kamogawensis]QWG10476.1 hypothetical protein KM029_26230 [Flammeovirga kamogawensis]TRX63587.1 hypothetical protein EO216_24515 [Flammeovirga kamogawensis]